MPGLYLLWWVQDKQVSPAIVAASLAAGDLALLSRAADRLVCRIALPLSGRTITVPNTWESPLLNVCVSAVANAPAAGPSERRAGVRATFGEAQTRNSLAPAAYRR